MIVLLVPLPSGKHVAGSLLFTRQTNHIEE